MAASPKRNTPSTSAKTTAKAPTDSGSEFKYVQDPKTGKPYVDANGNRVPNPSYAKTGPVTTTDQVGKQSIAQVVNPDWSVPVAKTTVGPAATSQTAQVGPASLASAGQVGPAAQSQGATIDTSGDNQFRGNQTDLISQLQGQANGTGPSVAGLQFQQAANQNIAQQNALAAGQRGSGGALAGRQAMLNSAGINQNLAGQSAIQRLQEQQQAQQALGNVINQGRTSDQNVAVNQATLGQQNNQFNTGQTNTGNIAQAGLTTNTNIGNAANQTNLTGLQGTLANTTNIANAANQNTLTGLQGTINSNAAQTDATNATNTRDLTASLGTQTSQFNSGQANTLNLGQAQIHGTEMGQKIQGDTARDVAGINSGTSKYVVDAQNSGADERLSKQLLLQADNNGVVGR